MRKKFIIEEGSLEFFRVDDYGDDILIDGENLVGEILAWLDDEDLAEVEADRVSQMLVTGLRMSVTIEVTDELA